MSCLELETLIWTTLTISYMDKAAEHFFRSLFYYYYKFYLCIIFYMTLEQHEGVFMPNTQSN